MSRSVAATTAAERDPRVRSSPSPPAPRRLSGPAYDPRRLRAVSGGGAAIAARVTDLALNVSGSRAMDRLVRSRGWIVIVGFGLIGIVAMQVSLLKLNAGIGRAVEASATLERGNAELRLDVSKLSAADRIQRLAAERGFVMPAPADVGYLHAGDLLGDGRRAAASMRPPDPRAADAPTTARPPAPQVDSAVAASAPDATSNTGAPSTTTGDGAPASPGAAETTPPAAAAQAPAVSGGATPPGATPSGGVAPPTPSVTAPAP